MADLKITDLGAALSVGDSNVTVLDDGSSTMKVTMNQLKEYSIGTTDISGIGNGTATGAISSVNTSKNNVRDSIAPTETSTASRAYEVGEKMYISDVLYKATRNIALGDPLVSGTNITPANDVSTEIIELKSDASEAIDSVKNIIAPVEDGGTAVLSYSVGDQFIHLGALCKAKTTINAGDTFIINTNYEDAGQVVDQLDSVKQALSNVNANQFDNGCVNILYNPITDQSVFGVSLIANDDGTISLSGTSENTMYFILYNNALSLKKGKYKLSGCPAGGSTSSADGNYMLYLSKGSIVAYDSGNGAEFELSEDTTGIFVGIRITNATNMNGKVFKPMITLADIPNSDYNHYVPYAKSNKELTDLTVLKQGSFSNGTMVSSQGMSYWQFGKVVTINGWIAMNGTQTADGTTANLLGTFSKIAPPPVAIRIPCGIANNAYDKPTEIGYLTLDPSLNLQIRTSSSGTKNVYFSMSYIAP